MATFFDPTPEERRALEQIANQIPDVQQKLVEGGNVASPSTPEEFRALVAREIEIWSRVIAAAGIRAG